MSLTKIYLCNLCHEEIKDGKGAGVHFRSQQAGDFIFTRMTEAESIHLCDPCFNRLRDLLPAWGKKAW